jgi:hypothetical protein
MQWIHRNLIQTSHGSFTGNLQGSEQCLRADLHGQRSFKVIVGNVAGGQHQAMHTQSP